MNAVMSDKTAAVSPVRPRSDGDLTERPQPRWSKERIEMP
jgi:hypothetical protein